MLNKIIVGNEYIFNIVGSDFIIFLVYKLVFVIIVDKIIEVNSIIQVLGLSKQLFIGIFDVGVVMSKLLGESVDFFMVNVYL